MPVCDPSKIITLGHHLGLEVIAEGVELAEQLAFVTFAHSKLTAFHGEVLDAFVRREREFFLTGGAALAGFHLGRRRHGHRR